MCSLTSALGSTDYRPNMRSMAGGSAPAVVAALAVLLEQVIQRIAVTAVAKVCARFAEIKRPGKHTQEPHQRVQLACVTIIASSCSSRPAPRMTASDSSSPCTLCLQTCLKLTSGALEHPRDGWIPGASGSGAHQRGSAMGCRSGRACTWNRAQTQPWPSSSCDP